MSNSNFDETKVRVKMTHIVVSLSLPKTHDRNPNNAGDSHHRRMSDSETTPGNLTEFFNSGIYRLENTNSVFIDPVRVLNRSYTQFSVSSFQYYSRFFDDEESRVVTVTESRKRKRNKKQVYCLNEKEAAANRRHRELRPLLIKAHESLIGARDLLPVICNLRSGMCTESESGHGHVSGSGEGHDFVELAKVWQAHMYEISVKCDQSDEENADRGYSNGNNMQQRVIPIFNNLVRNEKVEDMEAEFLSSQYILPRESCFFMSDLMQIPKLIPDNRESGFNLIVVDPPWENRSAHQKSKYPTLPNRYFLSLPIKQISHANGALVALWVTNREKLRNFVEKELFPKWGVRHVATFYWLKVKADGSLISDLDLFHHKPYECLLIGYCQGEGSDSTDSFKTLPDNLVIMSVPGDYSRKPPIGDLLLEYIPTLKPARCIELFAREMRAGWTSWGNEPLHFQESKHFLKKIGGAS